MLQLKVEHLVSTTIGALLRNKSLASMELCSKDRIALEMLKLSCILPLFLTPNFTWLYLLLLMIAINEKLTLTQIASKTALIRQKKAVIIAHVVTKSPLVPSQLLSLAELSSQHLTTPLTKISQTSLTLEHPSPTSMITAQSESTLIVSLSNRLANLESMIANQNTANQFKLTELSAKLVHLQQNINKPR